MGRISQFVTSHIVGVISAGVVASLIATAIYQSVQTDEVVLLCEDSFACGSRLALDRELDAAGIEGGSDAETNARMACEKKDMQLSGFELVTHDIDCDGDYGLLQWDVNSETFAKRQFTICHKKKVTVIGRVECK